MLLSSTLVYECCINIRQNTRRLNARTCLFCVVSVSLHTVKCGLYQLSVCQLGKLRCYKGTVLTTTVADAVLRCAQSDMKYLSVTERHLAVDWELGGGGLSASLWKTLCHTGEQKHWPSLTKQLKMYPTWKWLCFWWRQNNNLFLFNWDMIHLVEKQMFIDHWSPLQFMHQPSWF